MNRFRTWASKGNIIFVLIFLPAFVLGTLYHGRLRAEYRERIEARYLLESKTRHERLLARMTARTQLLDASVAFVESGGTLDATNFRRFGDRAMQSHDGVVAVCWIPERGESYVAGPREPARDLCDIPDFLAPSRVVAEPAPMLLLSRFASSTGHRGLASVIFELESLFLEVPMEGMDEYLIVQDTIENSIEAYSRRGGQLHRSGEIELSDAERYQHFVVSHLGSVNFLYLTKHEPAASDRPSVVVLLPLLWGLALVMALYVRHLAVQRDRVSKEVDVRTAELSQFAYRTSHDLRGPLITVGGLCRVVREDLEDGELEEVGENIARIERHVGRLDQLVGDILALTRADLRAPEIEDVDLVTLVDSVIDNVREILTPDGVAFRREIEVRNWRGSKARLSQIFDNLVSNAVKYRNPGRREPFVRIRVTARPDGALDVLVEDNGLGIPEDCLPRVFDSFARFHPEVSQLGSGLGLAIVKKHVDRMGGRLEVRSDDEGTRFRLRLPTSH